MPHDIHAALHLQESHHSDIEQDPSQVQVHDTDFDIPESHHTHSNNDEDLTLEALRAAISAPSLHPQHQTQDTTVTSVSHPQIVVQQTEKALAALNQLNSTNQTIVDSMNLQGVLQGLAGGMRLLVESNRRQADIVKGLVGLVGQSSGQL
jgi:hypothetical protein